MNHKPLQHSELSESRQELSAARAAPAPAATRRPIWRWIGFGLVGLYFFLGALVLVVRDFVWSDLARWRPQIEELAKRYTGNDVSIEGLQGHFYGFSPTLGAERVVITDSDGRELLNAKKLDAILSWRTVINRSANFRALNVQELDIQVDRVGNRQLEIAGLPIELPELPEITVREKRAGLQRWQLPEWVLEQRGFQIDRLDVNYLDQKTKAEFKIEAASAHTNETQGQRNLVVRVPSFTNPEGLVEFRANLSKGKSSQGVVPSNWNGQAWLQVVNFDPSTLTPVFRQPIMLREGKINGQAWFSLENSTPATARLDVASTNMRLQVDDANAQFQSAAAQIDAKWAADGSVQLTVSRAEATDQVGSRITVGDSKHTATFDASLKPLQADFSIKAFDVKRFHQFAMELPLPNDLKKPFAKLSVDGEIQAFKMSFDGTQEPTKFVIESQFEHLTVGHDLGNRRTAPRKWGPQIPSAENISGQVKITHLGGSATLRGSGAAIGFPGVFAQPRIPFEELALDLNWTVHSLGSSSERPDVQVDIERFDFANQDAKGSVTGTYRTAQSGPGVIDLNGKLTRARANRVHRYMPLAILPKVRGWMRESFVAGLSNDTQIVLSGNLVDFPFRKRDSGMFVIDSLVRNATFKYAPDWPEISKMRARVKIERGGLEVLTNDAQIYSVKLNQTNARIDDFRNAVLKLQGTATGSATQMLRYIRESPMRGAIREFATTTKIGGSARTDILLTLPLDNFDRFSLSGTTRLRQADVLLNDDLPRLSNVSGTVKFDERGVEMRSLNANLLGGNVKIAALVNKGVPTEITINGIASAEGLREFVNFPVTRSLSGEANYSAKIKFEDDTRTIRVKTDLDGMGVALPPPMYKQKKGPLGVTIDLTPLPARGRRLRGEELVVKIPEDKFEAIFRRDSTDEKRLRMKRGIVSIGDNAPAILPDSGMKVAVRGIPINADRWLRFWERDQVRAVNIPENPDGFFAGFDFLPTEATFILPSARYQRKRFHDVVVGATRQGSEWSANLVTTEANGYVRYTHAQSPRDAAVQAHFSRLELPESETSALGKLFELETPSAMPSIDLTAEHFVLGGKRLGHLKLLAVNREAQWHIDQLSLLHPAARFAASGSWMPNGTRRGGNQKATQMRFDLDITDAGQLLDDMGMPGTIRKSAGKISGTLSWDGLPLDVDYPSLDGALTLGLGRGQFLKTEPGMAKLIGVLSLQSLGRRLSLDFSDVFENGFAFDAIVGSAQIASGIARTDSLLMHGIQAEVLIGGSADLSQETQNLTVKVAPHINAGIASLAYAALANPAVGLGTLLAQIILDKPLKELFGYEFLVTGNWANPAVTQIERQEEDPIENRVYTPG